MIYAAEYTCGAWQPAGTGAESGFGVSGDGSRWRRSWRRTGRHLMLAWSDELIDGASTDTHLYVRTWNGTHSRRRSQGRPAVMVSRRAPPGWAICR